mmetsp:Transcript_58256/g.102476  ORF Transcript_58256/g.102476 Transcript_58256/m.102476 type:complete len:215 (-) Transcript_58256:540-1184(-)
MLTCLDALESLVGHVSEELADEVDGLRRRGGLEDAAPGVCTNLRELELLVVGVHGLELLLGRRAEDLDDLHQLVDTAAAGEDGRADQQLGEHAALRPHIDHRAVVRGPEDQLRRAVEAGADVRHIGLAFHKRLGGTEVAELEDLSDGVNQQVVRLDVSVADAHAVDVRQRAGQLVHIQLHAENRNTLFPPVEVLRNRVNRFGNELQHKIQINIV